MKHSKIAFLTSLALLPACQAPDESQAVSEGEARALASDDIVTLTDGELGRALYLSNADRRADGALSVIAAGVATGLRDARVAERAEVDRLTAQVKALVDRYAPRDAEALNEQDRVELTLRRLLGDKQLEEGWGARALREVAGRYMKSQRSPSNMLDVLPDLDTLRGFGDPGRYREWRSQVWEDLFSVGERDSSIRNAINEGTLGQTLQAAIGESPRSIVDRHADLQADPLFATLLQNRRDNVTTVKVEDIKAHFLSTTGDAVTRVQAFAVLAGGLDKTERQALNRSISLTELQVAVEAGWAAHEALKRALPETGLKAAESIVNVTARLLKKKDPSLAGQLLSAGSNVITLLRRARELHESTLKGMQTLGNLLAKKGIVVKAGLLSGIATSVFVGQLLFEAYELFGKRGKGQSPDAAVLKAIAQVLEALETVRKEMHERFDRVDRRLSDIYDQLIEQYRLVQRIDANVQEIQQTLLALQAEVQRVDRDVYAFMRADAQAQFHTIADTYLGYRSKWGRDIESADFARAAGGLYTWSTKRAADQLYAGPAQRDAALERIEAELSYYPELEDIQRNYTLADGFSLAPNINYLLSRVPPTLGLPAIATVRVANPTMWGNAANAFVRLAEENPQHARRMTSQLVDNVREVGAQATASLRGVASEALFDRLAAGYRASLRDLGAEVAAARERYHEERGRVIGGDAWVAQAMFVPREVYDSLSAQNLPRCDGAPGTFPAAALGNSSQLLVSLLALKRGLASVCVDARWEDVLKNESERYPELRRTTARNAVRIFVRDGTTNVVEHYFKFSESVIIARPGYPMLLGTPYDYLNSRWASVQGANFSTTVVDQPRRADLTERLRRDLLTLLGPFYDEVARRFVQAGDSFALLGARLSGARALIAAYTSLAMPVSLARLDLLRLQVFGDRAPHSGRDVVQAFVAAAASPPDLEVWAALSAEADTRVTDLTTLLKAVLDHMRATGEAESDTFLAGPLARIDLFRGRFAVLPTPAGSDVQVSSQGVRLSYARVLVPGTSSIETVSAADAGPLPPNYTVFDQTAFAVTALSEDGEGPFHDGPIRVCLTVPEDTTPEIYDQLRILAGQGGTLVDATTLSPDADAADFQSRHVCGQVSALGTVALARFRNVSSAAGVPDVRLRPADVSAPNATWDDEARCPLCTAAGPGPRPLSP